MHRLLHLLLISVALAQTALTQTINGISPDWAVAGGPGFTLSVDGSGLSGSSLSWNGVGLTVTSSTATTLTASRVLCPRWQL
jgi:hypothetical protein